jgi:uncharacterized protein (TIGR01615 family)
MLREDGEFCSVVLASKLVNIGYKVHLRTAIGGGTGQRCFQNLHHEFLVVAGEGDFAGVDIIVDPNFKEQFLIPQPTRSYTAVLEMLPEEFVGTAARLLPLVEVLCREMSAAFEEIGMSCPPWRQAKSMISKWLPKHVRDVSVGVPDSDDSDSPSNGDSSDGELLFEAGASPTTPLDVYPGPMPTPSGSAQAPTDLRSSTSGFKVKSLLSTGLATSAFQTLDIRSCLDSWQQPTIRTVKMMGRKEVCQTAGVRRQGDF